MMRYCCASEVVNCCCCPDYPDSVLPLAVKTLKHPMGFGQRVASRSNSSSSCLLKSFPSYLTSSRADTSSLEDAVANQAELRAFGEVPAGKVADCRVVQMADVAPGIYPLDRILTYPTGRTAGGAYSTGPDSDSLALAVSRTVEHYHCRRQVTVQTWDARLPEDTSCSAHSDPADIPWAFDRPADHPGVPIEEQSSSKAHCLGVDICPVP